MNLANARSAVLARPDDAAARKALDDAIARRDEARRAVDSARQASEKNLDDTNYSPIGVVYPTSSTGRRLALARWITDRNNPLTARVAINHIWMRHIGNPLIASVFDLGVNGAAPSHPALLDWLSVTFMDSGWSMKAIHRLIVMSAAYRMSSSSGGSSDPNLAIDPANQYVWRMNSRRLEAEAVRDNVLNVAGNLDLSMGGPDLDPAVGLTSMRRSIYFRHAKEKRVTFLRLFDSANVVACYRRSESVVPQQALALANSPLSLEQARLLARKLSESIGSESPAAFVATRSSGFLAEPPRPKNKPPARITSWNRPDDWPTRPG